MSELDSPPKRKFWQLYLSTAVLLSLAAGLLIWENTSWQLLHIRVYDLKDDYEAFGRTAPFAEHQEGRGWPLMYQFQPVYKFSKWELPCLVFDIVVGTGILATVASCCEYLIRRREGRKT